MIEILNEAKEETEGVFWIIEDELYAFPFLEGQYVSGIAKSGTTYNHQKLWDEVKPKGCNKNFDYYPRGRVVASSKQPIIYMSPHVDSKFIPEIKVQFGLRNEPKIIYDNSEHYKCYLDK